MSRLLLLLVLICTGQVISAQLVHTIKADSVKITSASDATELIIENHTQNVPGFLFNKGRGRTEFRKVLSKVNDSIYLLGDDTLNLSNVWLQGGNAFGKAGVLGTTDTFALRFFTNNTEKIHVTKAGRVGIGTSNPLAKLHIDTVGTSNAQVLVSTNANAFPNYQIINANPGKNAGAGMLMINDANQALQFYAGSTGNVFVPGGALFRATGTLGLNIVADYGVISFGRSPYLGRYEHARFLNNGYFGVGTQTPEAKVHVIGTGIFTDTLTATTMDITDSSNRVASTAFLKRALQAPSGKNFASTDLSFTGDRNHNGQLQYLNLNNFGGISMKTKAVSGWPDSELLLDTVEGFKLTMNDHSSAVVANSNLQIYPDMLKFNITDGYNNTNSYLNLLADNLEYKTTQGTSFGTLRVKRNQFTLGTSSSSQSSCSINGGTNHDGYLELEIQNRGGNVLLKSGNQFIFMNVQTGINDFRVIGLPSSSSSTDSMLVVDNNGQVMKRSQTPARKSATVITSSYTVPADVDVVFVNYTGGTATISLPTGTIDREITIKNLNTTNSVALSGLDASESNTIATRGAITVKYTGNAWVGINKY
jgi:hypothetical protein